MITLPQIRAQLEQRLSSPRYQHTLRVIESARPLAERMGVCRRKTRIAALLHDCAKGLGCQRLTELARDSDWEIPGIEYQ
ncbi:MAG: HD domain-containing protein, partial [Bacillota bacterium]